jgi:hypothetical protein
MPDKALGAYGGFKGRSIGARAAPLADISIELSQILRILPAKTAPDHERRHGGYQNSRKDYEYEAKWMAVIPRQLACWLRLGRINFWQGIKRRHRMAFLVIFRNNDTNCQCQKMNGKEKKQNTVLCVPSQKQKNEGTKK